MKNAISRVPKAEENPGFYSRYFLVPKDGRDETHPRSVSVLGPAYAAAISSCHEGFGDRSVFSHPLMKRFLRGVRRHRF